MVASIMSLFRDGPEYKKRLETPFKPTNVSSRVIFWTIVDINSLGHLVRVAFCRPQAFAPEEHWQGSSLRGP